jgi:aspartyl-tRNA(Asn)/glutamyl-tRNA(Gln) amidotransferase subunit C
MSVDKNTVRKVARLARIAMPEDRLAPMAAELNGILAWIEQLNEVDVEGVDAMTTPVAMTLPMREDVVSDGNIRDAVLANAPRTEDGFFVVPKVVE